MLLAFYLDLLNIRFMLMFMFIYVIFGGILIARFSSFIGYKKKRNEWDRVERTKMEFKSEKFS